MANTKVTGDLIASGTITADNLVSGTLDTLLNNYLTTNTYATQGYVTTAVNNLIDAAPASLDTLNELAAALNDDANFATTVTNSLATKLNLSGGTLTGALSFQDTSIPSAGTASIFSRNTNSYLYLQTGSGNQIQLLDGSQNTMAIFNPSLVSFSISNSEKMRIDSSGNVGIGTSSPGYKLEVNGTAKIDSTLTIADSGSAVSYLYLLSSPTGESELRMGDTDTDAGSIAYNNNTDTMVFRAGAANRVFINSSGDVGIGTTSPSQQLHVNGVTLSQGLYIPGLTTLPNTQGAIQADIPSTSYNAFRLRDTATGSSHTIHGFASNWSGGVSPGHLNLEGITAVSFGTWVGPNMIIHHSTGNVGIGIGDSTPDGRLTISAGAENQTAPVNAIRIKGPNVPSGANSSQNISWDFSYAGSAKIRANRGASWGTQIDFLTNTSSQGSDNPGVKLSILDNGGITFNGDTAAANALDDYEEGTWNPDSNRTFTHATYTKIGRMVTCQFTCTNPAGMSTVALPFTPSNTVTGSGASEQVRYVGNVQTFISGGSDTARYSYVWQGNAGGFIYLHAINSSGNQIWTASFGQYISQVTMTLTYITS